jgi:hypothetical protein
MVEYLMYFSSPRQAGYWAQTGQSDSVPEVLERHGVKEHGEREERQISTQTDTEEQIAIPRVWLRKKNQTGTKRTKSERPK